MGIKFDVYKQIKDKYCLQYLGFQMEYIFQLKLVRPAIQKRFPDIQIYLSCRDDLFHILEGEENVLPISETKNKFLFGYNHEIKVHLNGPHPVEAILQENDIQVPFVASTIIRDSKLCCLFTNGQLPSKSLSNNEIELWTSKIRYMGYIPKINPPLEILDDAGWVIGVENYETFWSASQGVKTTLLMSGPGTNLFRLMFPDGEVIKI